MKNLIVLLIILISLLGCKEEGAVYDQAYLNVLAGEWIVERLAYPEEIIEFTDPAITFYFNYCNIRETKAGTCTGYYQVDDNKPVDFEFNVDRSNEEIYFDVVTREEWMDDGFSYDQDTLGMDVAYFNVLEIANRSLILKGLTTIKDDTRIRETEYTLRKRQ